MSAKGLQEPPSHPMSGIKGRVIRSSFDPAEITPHPAPLPLRSEKQRSLGVIKLSKTTD
jgi:hypothetical protein